MLILAMLIFNILNLSIYIVKVGYSKKKEGDILFCFIDINLK